MNNEILKQIKYCREQKGMSLNELSLKSDVSYSYLLQLEKGLKTNPSLDILEKISNALDIDITFLFINN